MLNNKSNITDDDYYYSIINISCGFIIIVQKTHR